MKPTIVYIENAFNKYNALYFNNELYCPMFSLIKSKRMNGCLEIQGVYTKLYTIKISTYYDREQKDIDTTIIHEMIHLYIAQKNIKDNNSHGYQWQKIANRINQYGWNIQKYSKLTESKMTNQKANKQIYSMFMFKDDKNKYFIFRADNKYISLFSRNLVKFSNMSDIIFIRSNDANTFDRFASCRKRCVGKYISQDEYINFKSKYNGIEINNELDFLKAC